MPTRKDNTNVAPIYREPVFIPATEATLIKQKARPKINGLPVASGAIDIVSPEFDLLTGVRGIANLPKGFLKTNKLPQGKNLYYRQLDKSSKGLERAKQVGVIDTKSSGGANFITSRGTTLRIGKTFDTPFFSKGSLWYNNVDNMDVIVGKDNPLLDWKMITQHGRVTENAMKAASRRTPFYNGVANQAPTELFELYRRYPGIGYRNVTHGFPTMPITGLNTVAEQMKCGGRRKAQLGLDIREGGIAIPIANNMYYMSGRSHEYGGIAIGPNNKNGLEVEDGEIIEMIDSNHPSVGRQFNAGGQKQTIRVFSSVPFLRGVSPAQLVMGGANPDKVFKAQEDFKDRNKINDDGTRYEIGGNKIYTPSKSIQKQIQETGKITISGAPTIGGLRTYGYLKGLANVRKYGDKATLIFKAGKELIKRGTQKLVDKGKISKSVAQIPRTIYGQFIGRDGQNFSKTISLINNNMEEKKFGGEDTRSRNLRKLRNKFNAKGEYTGGQFGGSGAGSVIYNTPEYVTDTITKRYLVPTQQTFNDAFRQARQSGLDTFVFDDKVYNTKLGDNPNSRKAGMRTQTIIVPIERKEVRRRKKEFGGMIYTINGNVKNGLGSLRPKAKYGTIDKKDKDVKVGPDGLIYRRDARGEWWTDGTKHITAKPITKNSRKDLYYANPIEGLYHKADSNDNFIAVTSKVPEEYTKITRDFGKPKRTYLSTMDDEEKETKKIGSLIYEKDSNGRWVPSKNQSTTTTRDGGRPKDFGITRTGINHPNGTYKYHPLTSERIEEIVEESKETKSSKTSTPRKGGSRAATSTKAATKPSFTTGEKLATPTNPNEARYASRVQKGNAQEDVKPATRPQQTDTMTADQARYTRAAGFNKNAETTTSSTGGGQQSDASKTDERWIGQYKPIQTSDWIGLGANVLGSIGSYFITQKALKNIPEPVKPVMTPTVKLKTRYNIEPQLTESAESELVDRATVARNTASSNTSLARQQRISNRARQERAGYYGQKENIETQLINQDRLNRQQQMARNVAAYNDYLNRVYASKHDVATQRASSINNLITGLTGSVNSMLSGIETRRMNNNTLRAIAAANPNVDARLIGGFDYYDVFGSNRRYDRHGNLIRG